jgi:hypothetical protein
VPPKPRPLEDRFWEKVDKQTGGERAHWIWLAAIDHTGRGKLRTAGRNSGWTKSHRLAWELEYGPIPDGMNIVQRCLELRCVRPEHLACLPHGDAMKLAVKRVGTWTPHGEDNPNSKLSSNAVAVIRNLNARGYSGAAIGRALKTPEATVHAILRGERRRWG